MIFPAKKNQKRNAAFLPGGDGVEARDHRHEPAIGRVDGVERFEQPFRSSGGSLGVGFLDGGKRLGAARDRYVEMLALAQPVTRAQRVRNL
jgi:hypothetical protein